MRPRLAQLHDSGGVENQAPVLNAAGLWVPRSVVLTVNGDPPDADGDVVVSGSGSAHVVEDEGTPVTDRPNLSFEGAGVTVTDDGVDTTVVTIPGGSGSSLVTINDPTTFDTAYGSGTGASFEMDGHGTSIPAGLTGTALSTSTFAEDCGALVMAVPSAAGDNVRMIGAAVTGSSWVAAMKFSALLPRPGTVNYGMYIRDSASGKILTFARNQADGNIYLFKWTSPTGFSAVAVTVSYGVTADRVPDYWRIKKNSSSSYDFAISHDGVIWRTIAAAYDVSAWLSAPDEVGFHTNATSAVDRVACHWLRWR